MIEWAGEAVDAAGVAVIAVGVFVALGVLGLALIRKGDRSEAYKTCRQSMGRAILLGLELLVAADIIRTVAVTPDAQSVAVLAGIVAIRTFLSFSLELEITGRWPWQKKPRESSTARMSNMNRE